jgi:hypothetical protein
MLVVLGITGTMIYKHCSDILRSISFRRGSLDDMDAAIGHRTSLHNTFLNNECTQHPARLERLSYTTPIAARHSTLTDNIPGPPTRCRSSERPNRNIDHPSSET